MQWGFEKVATFSKPHTCKYATFKTDSMLTNYFKTAWRNLIRNKVSSFINIGGLAIGMAVAMLIALWIWDEVSFNKYHQNYNRICQVMRQQLFNGEKGISSYHPIAMGNELRSSYGGYFKNLAMVRQTEEHIISSGDKKFTQSGNIWKQKRRKC